MNGWFGKLLSHGGKETLLKAVASALPSHAMSCFKLPKQTTKAITSAMIEFWWNSILGRRKIAWVSWEKLCLSNSQGGMGFRDLDCYNDALLAKQCWRFIQLESSLCEFFFKSKYYPESDFLSSSLGSKPSFAWRSLTCGKDLLLKGLAKAIGNGNNTFVWTTKWLDNGIRAPLIKQVSIPIDMLVSDLISLTTGSWDEDSVQHWFYREDIERIKKIKPVISSEDFYVWKLSENGNFSVKSAYSLAHHHKFSALILELNSQPSLSPLKDHSWKITAPPKLKVFFWKIINNALPVLENLAKRNIRVQNICDFCGEESESVNHCLFRCHFACQLWAFSDIPLPQDGFHNSSVYANMSHLFQVSKDSSIPWILRRSIPWFLWGIWKARNSFSIEGKFVSPLLAAAKFKTDAELWFDANVNHLNIVSDPARDGKRFWKPPKPRWRKCNIGFTWCQRRNWAGASWVVRDFKEKVIIHSRRSFSLLSSRQIASLKVIHWAVSDMLALRFNHILFASEDCLLVKLLKSSSSEVPEVAQVYDLHALLSRFSSWNFVSESRHRNRGPYLIASSALRKNHWQSYIASGSPSWLSSLFSSEEP